MKLEGHLWKANTINKLKIKQNKIKLILQSLHYVNRNFSVTYLFDF